MFIEPKNPTDPSQNFIDRYPHPLDAIFHPKTIAIIGAKDDFGSVSRTILGNLTSNFFKGKIIPINPKRESVFDLKCHPSISSLNCPIDLAIIVTPAQTVPKLIKECCDYGVKSVIIISAGFKELGASGQQLEEEIIFHSSKVKMPIIGPNCLGIMNPIIGLNATFAKNIAIPGHLAFISQSGAMCTAVLDWSLEKKVGFSAFVSVGSMVDVNWGTLIDYLGSDPNTHSLLLYMETVGDARSFMTAAREVSLQKPIIVIKAGRSQAAAIAAASHTGAIAGSDEIFDAALERIGVLRVDTIGELFGIAAVLAKQPKPKGENLTVVTNAGGPGVLATDTIIRNHAQLTPLNSEVIDTLNGILPLAWSHSNPIDILGDATPDRYKNTIDILMKDSQSDGLLVILSPQDMTDPTSTAKQLVQFAKHSDKPILANWMGGESVKEGASILSEAGIPVFEYPDDAAKAYATTWRYSKNLKSLYEMPLLRTDHATDLKVTKTKKMDFLLENAKKEKRTLLNEYESKKILENYQIPVVKTFIAESTKEAVHFSHEIGFPVVLKLFSKTITHKTDVGGVKLNLQSENDVINAFNAIKETVEKKMGKGHFDGVTVQQMIRHSGYELILGSSTDPQFGPVLLFGMGGQLVEIFKDQALAIPPLNANLARKLMEKTKIYEALKGVRGRQSVDLVKLENLLIRFSQLIVENPRIQESDINPLIISDECLIAVDARIILHDWNLSNEQLPKLAIRPYPLQYITTITLKNKQNMILRPILPEDDQLIEAFHKELSENSVRQRYFEFISFDQRVAHERLVRICFNDYDREIAIIALLQELDRKKIVGIGRLMRIPGISRAQFKLIIADAYHSLGLGTSLMQKLLQIAKEEHIERVDGYILSENRGMLKICEKLGFKRKGLEKDNLIIHVEWTNRHL